MYLAIDVRFGSQADILPQSGRAAAIRREAAPQLASWRQSQYGHKPTFKTDQ